MKRMLFLTLAVAWCASASHAQLLNDGNMDALTIGTNPDNTVPAGAWGFPENYVGVVDELDPSNATIVETSSFDPGAPGNSLALTLNDTSLNLHLPNLFTDVIQESDGVETVVTFDIFISSGFGGGSFYIGGDHGGGGFSNVSDRGPQITFLADGSLTYSIPPVGDDVILATGYPFDTWITVRIDISLAGDLFGIAAGERGGELMHLGADLPFRCASGVLDHLDRFTRVNFGAFSPLVEAYIDNVTVETVEEGCDADFDGDGFVTGLDFDAYVAAFEAGDPSADFDGDTFVTGLDFDAYVQAFEAGCG